MMANYSESTYFKATAIYDSINRFAHTDRRMADCIAICKSMGR